MTTKHTPGPWKANGLPNTPKTDDFHYACAVWTANGETPICFTGGAPGRYLDEPKEMQDANARLIAAAPELLAALTGLTEWARTYTSPLDPNSPHNLLISAVAAIAKATGDA